MKIEQIKTSDLKPSEYNPRRADKDQVKHLTASIKKFGLVDPIIVNSNPARKNIVIGGHFRLRIAKDIGIKEVPVVYLDLNEKDERELNLRLNKNLGEWDWDLLAGFFDEKELKAAGFGRELDRLESKWHRDEDFDAEAERAAITKPTSKRGTLYRLGRHYLMCGDSMDPRDVAKLMGKARADLLWTDPPYNVNYTDTAGKTIKNDNMSQASFRHFLVGVFQNAYRFTTEEAPAYVCHATRTFTDFIHAFEQAEWHWNANITWLKESVVAPEGDFLRCSEPIMYGWKPLMGKKHYVNKELGPEREVIDLDRMQFADRLDVLYEARDKNRAHINHKPVKLIERLIKKSCPREGKVLDLFGGGGSTLIAAEITGRTAYLMELDPAYCDVIRKRYSQFGGNADIERLKSTSRSLDKKADPDYHPEAKRPA